MLKLGCTLQNMANFCLHKSTSAKFYSFTETHKDLLQKIWEEMVGDPAIVFTRKTVVDETFKRNSRNIWKFLLALTQASFVPILCVSPCQQDYTRDENMTQNPIGLNLNKTNPETLRTWLCHFSNDQELTVKWRVSTPQELRRRLIVSRQMVFAHIVVLCLRLWAASIITVHVRKHDHL